MPSAARSGFTAGSPEGPSPAGAPISLPPEIEAIVEQGTDVDPDIGDEIEAPLAPVPVVPDNFA